MCVSQPESEDEGAFVDAMRSKKTKEFDRWVFVLKSYRAQEEMRRAKDLRRRLQEKNKNAAIKNEEKLLAK